ncbi:hypothetical protein [Tropicibacter oceani]|uniref:DUF1344 domain-containing protein n=1 Tax=Tropicibacter oceani TaxID=3058420 RepID=A0ABY8QLT2_9RHOB|nr:hypothetical protein [Tropicibacter oceani]WGW05413.1 hypothetical protein QF118_07665 [Tropicibacter oceani]
MRILFAAVMTALVASPVLADETSGQVLAFDRVDGILVLTDKTVWNIAADLDMPSDLGAGDMIKIDYQSDGENGLTRINSIVRE